MATNVPESSQNSEKEIAGLKNLRKGKRISFTSRLKRLQAELEKPEIDKDDIQVALIC